MDWLRKTPAAPDEPEDAAKNHGNTVKKIERSQASEQTWTQQGNARILKILRARGFPAVEMVPMLVELQAGRYSASHNSTKAWNPVTGTLPSIKLPTFSSQIAAKSWDINLSLVPAPLPKPQPHSGDHYSTVGHTVGSNLIYLIV